jgi:hypothetical protein
MNERIKELWERACTRYSVYETLKPQDERKIIPDIFAELIIKECAEVGLDSVEDGDNLDAIMKRVHNNILKHFGVEE